MDDKATVFLKKGPFQFAGCATYVFSAALFVDMFARSSTRVSIFWIANGVILAYLLLVPRWRLWRFYAASFVGLSLAAFIDSRGHVTALDVCWNLLDVAEMALAASLLRHRSVQLPDFMSPRYLVRFLIYGALVAPLAGGLALSALLWILGSSPVFAVPWRSTLADSMGVIIAVPTVVAVLRQRRSLYASGERFAALAVLLGVVTAASFLWPAFPVILVVYPLLVLIVLTEGLAAAALAVMVFALAGTSWTVHEVGPFLALGRFYGLSPELVLQIAVMGGIAIVYCVNYVMARRLKAEERLEEIVALHEAIADNSRDVICLGDLDGRLSFVSSQVVALAGWSPEQVCEQPAYAIVHPADAGVVRLSIDALRAGSENESVCYRVRKKDGDYVWVEDNIRATRDPRTGVPNRAVHVLRDITDRLLSEERLREAYERVEALSLTDALTGIANRRHFDEHFEGEWRRAWRDAQKIGLLMIDVDFFKAYNDLRGHKDGDLCLKEIASVVQNASGRPGDLGARFGGEEFAVVLPNTDLAGTVRVGEAICQAVRALRMPHPGAEWGCVTVSVGCGAMSPRAGIEQDALIRLADAALYRAKRAGRNRVWARLEVVCPETGLYAAQDLDADSAPVGK